MNEMTAEEYIKEKNIKDTLYDVENPIPNQWIKGGLSKLLQDFTRLKCKEQREEVANELLNHEIDWGTPIKIDSQVFKKIILNSPEPEI